MIRAERALNAELAFSASSGTALDLGSLSGASRAYENALFNLDSRQTRLASKEFFDAVAARRDVRVALPGTDDLKFLDLMGADASAGGPGNLSILVRSDTPQRLTLTEEFLHGTQSRIFGQAQASADGADTAFREWHVRDFMNRHQKMFRWDSDELDVLRQELNYWKQQKERLGL